MSEYGDQKSLEEILQELVLYCAMNTADPIEIKLTLPTSILMRFSASMVPKERDSRFSQPWGLIKMLNLSGGTVEFV